MNCYMSKPGFYTVEEMQELTGLSRSRIYLSAQKKDIPSIKVGRRVIFPRLQVDTWLEKACQVAP